MQHWRTYTVLGGIWVLFTILHQCFVSWYLYWTISSLDIVMHAWGGALITATWHVLRPLPRRATSWLRKSESLLVLSVAMTVWEVVRYFWLTNLAPHYLFDTTTDTLAGLCGGLVIFFWYRSRTMD